MTVTFEQKQALIDLLATPSGWRSVFDNDFFDNALHQRHHGTPLHDKKKGDQSVGGRFRAFAVTDAMAEKLGLMTMQMLDAIKLILARDFGIEPNLKAGNARHYDKTMYFMYNAIQSGNMGNLELTLIPWDDVTEFEGNYTATPEHFTVQLQDTGFDVRLTAYDREGVVSGGMAARAALGSSIPPVELPGSDIELTRLFHILSKGTSVRGPDDKELVYNTIHVRNAPRLANSVRDRLMQHYHLKGYECAVFAIDRNLCLMVTNPGTLEKAAASRPSPYVPANN
jgi:hypothetical protein